MSTPCGTQDPFGESLKKPQGTEATHSGVSSGLVDGQISLAEPIRVDKFVSSPGQQIIKITVEKCDG